jgi:hypothetical protein
MPVIFSNPAFPSQVSASPFNQAYSVELNFGQMLRQVTNWNPNVDSEVAGRMINDRYRQFIDRRSWYGLKCRGVASVPNTYVTGTCTVTQGINTVQGIGTNWTPALTGLQFRQTFTQPYQTITFVNVGLQQLTLDTPYPGPDFTGAYYLIMAYLSFGANVKRLLWASNQLFGWPMDIAVPQQVLNARDQWRSSMGWATTMATLPPTPDGQFQVEVWPTPYAEQTFPFECYLQPPNLVLDSDSTVAWIRPDIIVTGAIADALMYRPKQNSYYDITSALTVAAKKEAQFQHDMTEVENADEALEQQAVTWSYEEDVVVGGEGSLWTQQHR